MVVRRVGVAPVASPRPVASPSGSGCALLQALVSWAEAFPGPARPRAFFVDFVPLSNTTSTAARLWINRKSWSGFHGFSSERNFSIHKVPLETYMSKLCVYFLIAPSAGFLIQPATM
jgi:hypothetical protein